MSNLKLVKTRDSVEEIHKVCDAALKITNADFAKARVMAAEQSEYNNPLRMATTEHQNGLGEHNMRVLDALENLRDTILKGAY